jgi:DNA polymerase-3 subunit delta'
VSGLASAELARRGRLYPAVILHGGDEAARRDAALALARTLLCLAEPAERPCGSCRHCRRITWPEGGDGAFHPDFRVLERDLKTATSVEAVRELLHLAQVSPFEARGQVFVVASAETLSGEAADALLKALEEPGVRAPRNFLLLAPSQFDLLPTLRSRSLAIYLGPAATVDDGEVERLAAAVAARVGDYGTSGAAVHLLAAAEALTGAADWSDPRAGRPWTLTAAAAARAAARAPRAWRRPLLDLANALLEAPPMRLRGIAAQRIVEGLVFRHLGGAGATARE